MLKRRTFTTAVLGAACAAALPFGRVFAAGKRKPNFVVILCDDLGYGDVGIYGSKNIPTPALDKMAREGVLLTSYYSAANICTPSRAGLLTGRYAIRSGVAYEVIMAHDDPRGLPASAVTIGNVLQPDYATGLFGKWHLGTEGDAWPPTKHGFDTFFGIPYSHDMKPLALYEADAATGKVDKFDVDYPMLQQQFYAHAETFIEANKDRPFFVELALSAPHLPEYPHPPFLGKSGRGPYGDVVMEIDSIVDRLLKKLKELGLDRDTLVIFTSDNGPWYEGSTGGLRDRKGGAAYDGGYRVPFIAWQPGVVPAGMKSDSIAMGIDILPTLVHLAGKELPAGLELDGRDISGVLLHGAPSPHEELVLFDSQTVVGIRTQNWKYVTAGYYRGIRIPYKYAGYDQLFDMRRDPTESYSVAKEQPDVFSDMKRRLDEAVKTFGPLKAPLPPFVAKQKELLSHLDQD
ncbi:MAG TPA: sulfatase [Alphaproteobacteria bacterium]|nr:sulfatase [Alphaproteobacteria bacterium]